jgi:hypothetical protein
MRTLAVKTYRTPDRLTMAAPMLGLLPGDVGVELTATNQLVLRGAMRGITADLQLFHRLQELSDTTQNHETVEVTRELLLDEWSVGPYYCILDLPHPVDGSLATATYGNGVLAVTLPVAEHTPPARFSLDDIGTGRGERVGSLGHPIRPFLTTEHARVAHVPRNGVDRNPAAQSREKKRRPRSLRLGQILSRAQHDLHRREVVRDELARATQVLFEIALDVRHNQQVYVAARLRYAFGVRVE